GAGRRGAVVLRRARRRGGGGRSRASRRRRSLAVLTARLLPALLLRACDPYDPALGDTPFRCGTDEPRCPEGYLAVDITPVRCECQRASSMVDAGPDSLCDVDPNESTDSPGTASEIDPVSVMPSRDITGLAICPRGDQDFFSLLIMRQG